MERQKQGKGFLMKEQKEQAFFRIRASGAQCQASLLEASITSRPDWSPPLWEHKLFLPRSGYQGAGTLRPHSHRQARGLPAT